MDLDVYLALFLASTLISISPGAGAVLSMNSGLSFGLKKSYATIFGLQLGYLIQAFIVIIGLGAIMVKSVLIFSIIKWAGVLYLVYLGLSKIFEKVHVQNNSLKTKKYNAKKAFISASLINLTNPKATVFLVAFIPQFLDPNKNLWIQFFIIGSTLCLVDIIVMTGYSSLASKLKLIIKDKKALKIQNILTGCFLVIAALFLSLTSNS